MWFSPAAVVVDAGPALAPPPLFFDAVELGQARLAAAAARRRLPRLPRHLYGLTAAARTRVQSAG